VCVCTYTSVVCVCVCVCESVCACACNYRTRVFARVPAVTGRLLALTRNPFHVLLVSQGYRHQNAAGPHI